MDGKDYARMYRTGDLGKLHPGGVLEFCGNFRIETISSLVMATYSVIREKRFSSESEFYSN